MLSEEWPCGMLGVSHRGHRATQMPCGMLGQTTDRTAGAADRHRFFAGGVNLHLKICVICGRETKRTAKKSVFPSDAEWGMTIRDDWSTPTDRSNTDAMRRAFIKKHGFHRCARIGLFTDSLLLLRVLLLGF